jgi:hypothetical protein
MTALEGRHAAISADLEGIRTAALQALGTISPRSGGAGERSLPQGSSMLAKAGDDLPPYYLIYFLFVELLRFPHYGRAEKVAWGIPFEYQGNAFFVAHHKFGVRLFAPTEAEAAKVVSLIWRAIKKAEPFFTWLAERAVSGSELNVVNRSRQLLERFEFYRDEYQRKLTEPVESDEDHIQRVRASGSAMVSDWYRPAYKRRMEAGWLGLSAIDGFFSWTEHVLIHLAILKGRVTTGKEVAKLAGAIWADKFKAALDIANAETKTFYDNLAAIRCQFRNFNAHGAFGKQGEAFSFHSGAGAVPVRLTDKPERPAFSFSLDEEIPEAKAIQEIERFIGFLRRTECAALSYIQDSDLPTILSYTTDGTYQQAMGSVENMEALVRRLTREWEQAANMDW